MTDPGDRARCALSRWKDFPVDAPQRPVVLVEPRLSLPPFRSARAQDLFRQGHLVAASGIPHEVIAALSRSGERANVAGNAFGLRVLAARPTRASFLTDRGSQELPAWELEIEQALEPAYLLDPEVNVWEPRERVTERRPSSTSHLVSIQGKVRLSSDGYQLGFDRIALPGGPPPADVTTYETPKAVTVIVVDRPTSGPLRPVPAVGIAYRIDANLVEPLGRRVVVDIAGEACSVEERAT